MDPSLFSCSVRAGVLGGGGIGIVVVDVVVVVPLTTTEGAEV
jgi:hypothetical protein